MDMWHNISEKKVMGKLQVTESGLSIKEAENRLKKYGENRFEESKKTSFFSVRTWFLMQKPKRTKSP